MTTQEYLLTCLSEECAEVSHRVSKALRFGLDEVGPGQQDTNKQRLVQEFIDLCAIMDVLVEEGIIDEFEPAMEMMVEVKKEKLRRYMQYSREQGTLYDGDDCCLCADDIVQLHDPSDDPTCP